MKGLGNSLAFSEKGITELWKAIIFFGKGITWLIN
jgi:hypothetical protein